MKRPKIEIWPVVSGNRDMWYFRVKARNGEILCHSETYTSKQSCLKGIKALRKACVFGKMEDNS